MIHILKTSLILFSFLIISKCVFAVDSSFYYQGIFKLWGNESAVISSDTFSYHENFIFTDLADQLKAYFPISNRRAKTAVILSSDYSKIESKIPLNIFTDIFVICNTDYNFSAVVKCNYTDVSSASGSRGIFIGRGKVTNRELYVFKENVDGYTLHLIPEILLVTPEYSPSIESYIKAVDTSIFNAKPFDSNTISSVLDGISIKNVFKNKFAILTVNSVLALLSMSIFYYLYTKFNFRRIHKIDTSIFFLVLEELKRLINRYNKYLKVTFVFALIYWISFHFISNIHLIKNLELKSAVENIAFVTNPLNISSSSENFVVNLLAFMLINAMGLVFFILMLPLVIDFIVVVLKGAKVPQLKSTQLVIINALLVLLVDIILVFGDARESVMILSCLVVLLYISVLQLRRIFLAVPKRFQTALLVLFALFPLLLLGVKFLNNNSTSSVSEQKLVTIKNKMILLPYQFAVTSDTKYVKYEISPTTRLFLNDYLFYDPKFTKIVVKPLSTFNNDSDWIIYSFDTQNYLFKVNKNPLILPNLFTLAQSKYLSIDLSGLKKPIIKLTLAFDCRVPLDPKEVKIKVLGPESLTGIEQTIFKFPGCTAQEGPKIYTTWIEKPLSSAPYLWEIIDYDNLNLLNLTFTTFDNFSVPFNYLKDPDKLPVLAETIVNRDATLTAYSFSVEAEKEFTRDAQKINLSTYINDFIQSNPLVKRVVIWSNSSDALLENITQSN